MENTGQIVRSRKTGKSRYTPINNDILQSKTLTPEEKSILVHLLSLPEDWVTYKTVIWEDMNIGRDRFNKHWKGLVDKGYIVSIKYIKPNGQFGGYNHVVYEEPVLPVHQVTENQGTVIQFTDNQVTEIQETGIQLTGVQCVNKVITKQSNNLQSNNLESNNIIPKEDNIVLNIPKEENFENNQINEMVDEVFECCSFVENFCNEYGVELIHPIYDLVDEYFSSLSDEEKINYLWKNTK